MPTLGLFAKWPRPGDVKTRLAASTSPEFAARVAEAFLRDSLERYAQIEGHRLLLFTPEVDRNRFAEIGGGQWDQEPQIEGDLGRRLNHFFDEQFKVGPHHVIAIGTDSPTLPIDYVRQAFALLASHDVVIGPATDGGYYLVGLSRPCPELFTSIDWGGPRVLTQTVAAARGTRLALLPPWYDVDSLGDWRMLAGHVAAMRRAGIDPLAPRTEALLAEPVA